MAGLLDFLTRYGAPDPDGAQAQADVPSGSLLAHILGGLAQKGAGTVQSAVTAPRDAYRGDLQVFDPATGHVSDEALQRANEMAGVAMTGSVPMSRPAGSLGTFAGRLSKTADQDALAKAEGMLAAGADRQAVWDQTGWFKGVDGKMRYEINDVPAFLKGPGSASEIARNRGAALGRDRGQETVGDVLWHPDLMNAYPETKEMGFRGFTGPENNRGALDLGDPLNIDRRPTVMLNNSLRGKDAVSTALHELQHGIQEAEGFASGGNPAVAGLASDPAVMAARKAKIAAQAAGDDVAATAAGEAQKRAMYDAYRRQAGEVEARNVQSRHMMTPAERRAQPPWMTQDVPDADQIVNLGMRTLR